MAVVATDIKCYLSGGSGNTSPAASLGGAISTTEINNAVPLNNLFDDVSDVEAASGDTEYRCMYVKNTNGSSSLTSSAIYIASNTPSADTAIQIGLDPAGVNGVATTVANENTAPAGVTFSSAANSGAALAVGTLAAGAFQAVWIKRVVDADAAAAASDPVTLRVTGTP
jgi:hypothetical protein